MVLECIRNGDLAPGLGHALPAGLSFEREPLPQDLEQPQASSQQTGCSRSTRPGRPERLVRSVLASRACSDDFGPMMQQAAWE